MISGALAILKSEAQRNEISVFYEKYKNRFLSIASNILQNEEQAEDAVQEAFLKIADKPTKFFSLNETKRTQYMCAVVKNASVDILNKRNKVETVEITDDIVDIKTIDSFESLMIDDISNRELIEFIKGLPKLQQNVLALTRLSKLSISETAQQLNVSEKAVNQRLYLARKAIKQFIEERRNCNV